MGKINILQPTNCKFEDIKHEISQTENTITDIATYPNGFVLTLKQSFDCIEVSSNKPLIKVDESTFQIPD